MPFVMVTVREIGVFDNDEEGRGFSFFFFLIGGGDFVYANSGKGILPGVACPVSVFIRHSFYKFDQV